MPENTQKKFQIMIVDDVPDNLKLLYGILMPAGYLVRSALNGETALASIRKSLPDLILLDIMMHGLSGYEVCQQLKADEHTRNIPVIFLSALDKTLDKIKAFDCGGADYVAKPFEEKELLARIKTHLSLAQLRQELLQRNAQLQEALDNIKTMRGLLPICANCKNIRDDQGQWRQLEEYITQQSEAQFSHGICPQCMEELYGKEDWYIAQKNKITSAD